MPNNNVPFISSMDTSEGKYFQARGRCVDEGAWTRVRGRAGCPLDRIGLLFYAVLDAKRTI